MEGGGNGAHTDDNRVRGRTSDPPTRRIGPGLCGRDPIRSNYAYSTRQAVTPRREADAPRDPILVIATMMSPRTAMPTPNMIRAEVLDPVNARRLLDGCAVTPSAGEAAPSNGASAEREVTGIDGPLDPDWVTTGVPPFDGGVPGPLPVPGGTVVVVAQPV